MNINSISFSAPIRYYKTSINNTNSQHKKNQFKGKPKHISESYVQSANNPAVSTYHLLKNGSYLDSHDDKFNPYYKKIRESNFHYLYKLNTDELKKEFIDDYKKVTGFPDLNEVSKKIEKEFVSGIRNAEKFLGNEKYNCVSAGYDSTCSVGKKLAFPGSDLDKSYIILKGTNYDEDNIDIVNKFSSYLWENTDQRILSYNHDTSFPTIMTVKQVNDMMRSISTKTKDMAFDKDEMQNLVENEYRDLEKAAKFNIMVSDYFPVKNKYTNSPFETNKEDVKNFAYFIEAYRDGKELITSSQSKKLKEELKENNFYKYSNVAQMKAMKNAVDSGREQKTKILKRMELQKEFNDYPINKQYAFIVNLIKYCSEDQTEFPEYFRNDYNVKEKYKPLLGRLTKGDRDNLYIPEFTQILNGYNMKYGECSLKNVDLYKGYAPNVLWVDSSSNMAIDSVLENIDHIKKIKLFENIDTIQTPKPEYEVTKNFYPIQYKTAYGHDIQEMKL